MNKTLTIAVVLEVIFVLTIAILLPEHVAMAAGTVKDLAGIKKLIVDSINNIFVPVIFSIAFIVFLVGVFKYFIAGAADQESQNKGKQLILYGIVGFAIMVSVWGLVNVLVNSLGLSSTTKPAYPKL